MKSAIKLMSLPIQVDTNEDFLIEDITGEQEPLLEFEGVVMGVRHKEFPIFGVQFHPESILTPAGGKIIENALSIAEKIKA